MRVTSKGQVTIPRELCEPAGIAPDSEGVFALGKGRIVILPEDDPPEAADRARLAGFLDSPDRLEGTGDPMMDADDVMALTRDR